MFPTFNMKIFTLNFFLEFILSIIEQKMLYGLSTNPKLFQISIVCNLIQKNQLWEQSKVIGWLIQLKKSYVNINTWIDGY